MTWILSWLKPNRLDGQIYLLSLLCFLAIALPTLAGVSSLNSYYYGRGFNPMLAPFLGAWLAVACCYGCLPWKSIFSRIIFLLLCFLSLGIFVFAASYSGVWVENIAVRNGRQTPLGYKTLGMFFGTFAMAFFSTRLIAWFFPKVVSRSERILKSQTRVRWMIIFAIGLYLFFLASNFIRADINFLYTGYSTVRLWLFVPLGCLFFVVVPGLIAFRVKRLWLAIICVILYFTVAGTVFFSNFGAIFGNRFEDVFFAILLFSFVFALSCFVIRAFYEQAAGVKQWKRLAAPSVFGWLMGIGVGLAALGWYFFEPATLLLYQGDEKFEIARNIRQLQSSPGTRVVAAGENFGVGWGNVVNVVAELSDDTPVNFFDPLSGVIGTCQLTIKDMRPHVATKCVRNQPKNISIENGTITTDQFADLIEQSNVYCVLSNLTVKPGAGDQPLQKAARIHIEKFAAGNIGKLLNSIPDDATVLSITIGNSQLNADDWKAVFKVGEFHKLSVSVKAIDQGVVAMAKQSKAAKLSIVSYASNANGGLDSNSWQMLLQSDVGLQLPHLSGFKSKEIWDAVFGCRGPSAFGIEIDDLTALAVSKDFGEQSAKSNWSYDFQTESDPLSAQRMYLPLLSNEFTSLAAKFKQLRSLSFDKAWLPAGEFLVHAYSAGESRDLARLRGLNKLEELYLPENAFIGDFRFLQGMPALRHLQVDSAVASSVPGLPGGTFRAAFCPKLESLVMFCSPDPTMKTELAKSTSLKQLTIVDASQAMTKEDLDAEQKRLAAALGNIEVRMLPLEEFKQEIPDHFKQHVKQIRERAAKKYLKPATENDAP